MRIIYAQVAKLILIIIKFVQNVMTEKSYIIIHVFLVMAIVIVVLLPIIIKPV